MAKLSFIDQLDESQLEYANKIAIKAKEMGVPPNLAIAIAYHESRLNPNAPRGTSGEFGIMQVMPKTGKGMGYTNKDLSDPDKNIEAGLKYLKQNLDAFGGDPKMATVGYNAGTDSAFFSGGELPKVTEAYVKAMKGYGAYGQEPAEKEGDMVVVDAPPAPPPTEDTSGANAGERFLGGAAGVGVGTAASGIRGVSNARTNMAATRAGAEETARIAAQQRAAAAVPPGAAPAAPPGAPKPPLGSSIMFQNPPPAGGGLQVPMGAADAGRMAPGQTGNMVYNYGKAAKLTDIEAGRALDMTKEAGGVHDLTTQRRENLNKIQTMFPGEKYVENPRFGGLMTLDQGVGSGPRASYKVQGPVPDLPPGHMPGPAAPAAPGSLVQIPKPQPVPTTPPPPTMGARMMSGLDSVNSMFKNMMRPVTTAVGTAGKYAVGPLAGLSAGLDLSEIAHEYDKPADQRDYTKMGLKAASAIGGGLSLIPATAPLGIPLSLGATAADMYRDNPEYIKQKIKEYTGYSP
jgi:hypothetical protein